MTKTKINMTVNGTRQQDKIELYTLNQICLKENNRLRYLHNSPKLRLSNRLMKSAQLHSEHLHELRQLQQLTDLECGQNMALIIGEKNYKIAGLNAVRAWYKQSENYDYNEHNQEFKGYFTQMIWRKTDKVGFGFTKSATGNTFFVVGHYLPIGNKSSDYKDNVLPKIEGADMTVSTNNTLKFLEKNSNKLQQSCFRGHCVII
ncbi:Golgi-associated plant pathogenesis-related protein 1 [Schistosoma japonicum]|nr:Golgi-associated plant pathogenesis-related protein 1 [Schistosoma japonicum]